MLIGTLSEFGLVDVMSLLADTKKTGVLQLDTPPRRGQVWFQGGEVHFALADTRRLALGARLVASGLLPSDRLPVVVAAHRAVGSGRFGQVLLDEGLIDEATLDELVGEQITDGVFDLMRAEGGDFRFEPRPAADGPVGLRLNTQDVVAECVRRMADWRRLGEAVRSPESAVELVTPAGGAQGAFTFTPDHWRVITLLNGARTVGDVTELLGQGEFATCRKLGELEAVGAVRARPPGEDIHPAATHLAKRRDAVRDIEERALGATPALQAAEAVVTVNAPRSLLESLVQNAAAFPPQDSDAPVPPPAEQAPVTAEAPTSPPVLPAAPRTVDRAQMARELASIGFADTPPERARPRPQPHAPSPTAAAAAPSVQDDDANAGMMRRLTGGGGGA